MEDKNTNKETDQKEFEEQQIADQAQEKEQKRCDPCMHCGYHCKFLNE